MTVEEIRPSGHVQIVERRAGRRWHALWRDADGRHQRVLGPAWVKDSGKRTPLRLLWRRQLLLRATLELLGLLQLRLDQWTVADDGLSRNGVDLAAAPRNVTVLALQWIRDP